MVQAKWIVSAKYDLTFFIGSVLVSFAFMAAFYLCTDMGFDALSTALALRIVFFYGLDQPHIFQTAARIYGDEEQFRKMRYMVTVGFAAICVGLLFSVYFEVFRSVRTLIAVYGSYHIVRQNVGFLKAYRRCNGDDSSERFDVWMYSLVMFAFIVKDYSGDRWQFFGVAPPGLHGRDLIFFPGFGKIVGYFVIACIVVYTGNLVLRAYRGQMLNVPKLLLMGATGTLHGTLYFFTHMPAMITTIETAYHDVQYQGWMAKFQQRRFGDPKVWKKWLVGAFAFSALSASVYFAPDGISQYLQAVFLSAILFHYIIDGEIWKFGEDARLREMFFPQPKSSVIDLPSREGDADSEPARSFA